MPTCKYISLKPRSRSYKKDQAQYHNWKAIAVEINSVILDTNEQWLNL